MRRMRMVLIGTAAAGWALAGLAGEGAPGGFGNDDSGHDHVAASETLSDKAWPFVSGQGYQTEPIEKVNDAIAGALELADGSSVFLPGGTLGPFVKAVLALEQAEEPLERVRLRLRYGQDVVTAPPAISPVPVSFVQIERFNLGPAIRAELAQAHGAENVAAAAEFGVGPHLSWRLVMRPVMGHQADIVAVSRKEISDADARAQTCFDASCLSTAPVIDPAAPWSAMEAAELEADVPYRTERDGLITPAAAVGLLAEGFGYEMREGVGPAKPFAQAIIELNLGQDANLDAALREGALMDDSLRARWSRVSSMPTGADGAPTIYTARAFECRRGPEFPEPGEYCP